MRILFLASAAFVLPLVANAQTLPPKAEVPQSMNSLTIESPSGGWMHPQLREQKAKDEKEKSEKDAKKKTDEKESAEAPLIPLDKPIFTEITKLKAWRKGDELYTAGGSKRRTEELLKVADAESGFIPPTGLLQVARLYAEQGNMDRAARYYYGAQLRARFDFQRWPIRDKDSPYMKLTRNVQEGDLGKIGRWATASSGRLEKVMNDVRLWDMATEYSYHPGFRIPLGKSIPDEKVWPDLLSLSRDAFFKDAGNITQALRSMGR